MIHHNGNGHRNGNGHQAFAGTATTSEAVVVEKPKTREVRDEREENKRANEIEFADVLIDDEETLTLDEGDEPASHDVKNGKERSGRLRRVLIGFAVACVLFLVSGLVIYLWLLGGRTESNMSLRVGNTNQKERAETSANTQPTSDEINNALNGQGNANNQTTGVNADGRVTAPQQSGVLPNNVPITNRLPNDIYSATVQEQLTSAQTESGERANGQAGQTSTASTDVARGTSGVSRTSNSSAATTLYATSGANTERSIRAYQPASQNETSGGQSRTLLSRESTLSANVDAASIETRTVPLPPLGTMLPVRTLGTIYTLRSETLVRMQLTRAMSGAGWSLSRGTELYGTVRGSDFEIGRAYIALIGFIDPESNRLVRLQGNILGGDGTDGLRGRKHTIGGGWSRALRMAGAGALDALGAIAGNIGRRPIVVADVYGYGGMNPLINEIGGISTHRNRSGFVEVAAGSSGYVLVMQMPRDVQGVDAGGSQLANLSSLELERLADASSPVAGTQLSDEQLAALITTGTPEQIRAGLPRMTPEMRRVAESVLASSQSSRGQEAR